MFGASWLVVVLFCLFSSLLFYVQKHGSTFQGADERVGLALNLVGILGFICQLALYGMVWYTFGFLALLAMFGLSLLSGIVFVALELILKIPMWVFSMLGLVAVPAIGAWLWVLLLSH